MPRPKKQDADTDGTSAVSAPAAGHAPAGHAPHAAADAFAKVEPELAAVPADALGDSTIDAAVALATVLAAAPRIREHRAAIEEQLPKHPLKGIDQLETYAHAAWYAHLVHAYASTSPEASKALVEEAGRLRDGLLIAAEALAHRALLDVDAVARIRKGGANPDLAGDLTALAGMFKEAWGKVSTKTAVERSEIDRAAELGPAVLVAAAAKKHKGTDTEAQRAKALALLVDAYDGARRAIGYLRWKEGDLDVIAPSLHKKRPGRKPGKKDGSPEQASEPEAPPADA
jgi:hypothetical protein